MKGGLRRKRITREARSRIMRAIRGRNTRPEVEVRRALHAAGLRFRLHESALPGRPDIVLRRHRAVVFVNGCFWHQHAGCASATRPKVNKEYWIPKLKRVVRRDVNNARELSRNGWRVFVIWECELSAVSLTRLAAKIRRGTGLPRPSSPTRLRVQ